MSEIKIFVSHRIDKESQTIDNPLYVPVRCGAIFDKANGSDIIGDDTGKHISERRMSFNELTVQYWAWQNIETDYYGLCHYRRYLSFSDETWDVDENGQVQETCMTERTLKKHNLVEKNKIEDLVKNHDILIGAPLVTKNKNTPKGYKNNVKEHYEAFEGILFEKNLLSKVKAIIKDNRPEYVDSFDRYMKSDKLLGYNCFIMKKEYFFEMCEFQFDILFELEKNLDTTYYSETMLRTFGFVGEILYATYIMKKTEENVNMKSLQIVFFTNTDKKKILLPASENNNIPIVLMSSNYYVPYLSVFFASLLQHLDYRNFYDIVVLEKEITKENKQKLLLQCNQHPNVRLEFYNPSYEIGNAKFYIAHEVYAEEAYYRLLVPWILEHYDKAIVMDCDIVVKHDLAALYAINVTDYLAAGVTDIVFQGILNGTVPGTYEYVLDEMRMQNPYDYINTGVLVMNLSEWRKQYKMDEVIEFASSKKFRIQEQDILNVLLEGKIKQIDTRWNYYVEVSEFIATAVKMAPNNSKKIYESATENPYLIHYAGIPKPWNEPEIPKGEEWWSVAKNTPFYEIFLKRMTSCETVQESRIKKIIDILLPKGTIRREFIKKVIPRDSLRWRMCKKIY